VARGPFAVSTSDRISSGVGDSASSSSCWLRRSRCACTCTARGLSGERRARAWHAQVGPPETYAKGPRRFSTSAWQSGARDLAARLVPGELWPLTSLLRRLEDTEASPDSTADTDGQAKLKRADGSANASVTAAATLWGSLERASGAAAVASLSRQTGSGYRHPRTGSGFPGSHLYRSMMGYGEPLTPAAAAARGYAGAFQLLSVRLRSALDCLWMATNCN
jgi:hypothetical protein